MAEEVLGGDYHWYRQNFDDNGFFDGTWSHKPGTTQATNRELERIVYRNCYKVLNDVWTTEPATYEYGNKVITDPTKISRITTIYKYDSNGVLLQTETSTNYSRVVGAYVVGM